MDITTQNPVGTAQEIDTIEEYINSLAQLWDTLKQGQVSKWWEFWKKLGTTKLVEVTNFLIKALDDLIALVDDKLSDGADKKATVMDAISRLYDYIIAGALPIWMKPFSGTIKDYVINGLVSSAIDWIVNKYKNGEWRKKIPDPLPVPAMRLVKSMTV